MFVVEERRSLADVLAASEATSFDTGDDYRTDEDTDAAYGYGDGGMSETTDDAEHSEMTVQYIILLFMISYDLILH